MVTRVINSLLFVGTMALSDEEVQSLRAYLLKGGFLWVDDYWGDYAWDQWVEQIARVLPPAEFPIVDLPLGHPIWQSQFLLKELPQIPAIQSWRRLGYDTSERGEATLKVGFHDERAVSTEVGVLVDGSVRGMSAIGSLYM
jgi:hypothetical protein